MKRLTRVLALLLIFGTLPAVATDKAKAFYKQGLDDESPQTSLTGHRLNGYDFSLPRLMYTKANSSPKAVSFRRP
jgi:hypothetical protein